MKESKLIPEAAYKARGPFRDTHALSVLVDGVRTFYPQMIALELHRMIRSDRGRNSYLNLVQRWW